MSLLRLVSNQSLISVSLLGAGRCSANGGSGGWLCQHRWTAIAGMVGFRKNAGDTDATNWQGSTTSTGKVAFGRGSLSAFLALRVCELNSTYVVGSNGFVVINHAADAWSTTFTTSLTDGTYCDVINGSLNAEGRCTGTSSVTCFLVSQWLVCSPLLMKSDCFRSIFHG